MKPDPSEKKYNEVIANYNKHNYESVLQGWVMRQGHLSMESLCVRDRVFKNVLEVGAGSASHLPFLSHKYQKYFLTDKNTEMLNISAKSYEGDASILVQKQKAQKLDYPDSFFDRLIACHVLEHLPNPYLVLREWHRVVKPGGAISILLPCDPGLLWMIGRKLSGYKRYRRDGVDMNYWMAREHINPIGNLLQFIRYYFDLVDEKWWPCSVSLLNANLFYSCNITVTKINP